MNSRIREQSIKLIILVFLYIFSLNAFAELLKGKVISIKDGDTAVILSDKKIQMKVRLAEIDAPEKEQDFGQVSKQSLSDLIFGKEVTVEKVEIDKYGRIVGKIFLDKKDINAEQVKKGMAWVYTQYNKSMDLMNLEKAAKNQKIGLWANKNPIPPWQWRRQEKGPKKKNLTKSFPSIPYKNTSEAKFSCMGKKTCKEMSSCIEAKFYLNNCGLKTIDGNKDGVPCRKICR